MRALEAEATDAFRTWLSNYLRSAFHEQTALMTQRDLDDIIDFGIVDGRRHGVITENDVRRYVEFLILHGIDWRSAASTTWASEVLDRANLSGEEKMDLIEQRWTST